MLDFLKSVADFILLTVVVKIIIGHWVAERIMLLSQKIFGKTERNMAIWLHYKAQAAGHGHFAQSVLSCGEDKCGIFRA
jgi:hypothetical protein